jgi:hypothetical protein
MSGYFFSFKGHPMIAALIKRLTSRQPASPRTGALSARPIRFIETVGCMGEDGPMQVGQVVGEVAHKVYGGGNLPHPFYVVQFQDGTQKQVAQGAVFRGQDGVLEYRF